VLHGVTKAWVSQKLDANFKNLCSLPYVVFEKKVVQLVRSHSSLEIDYSYLSLQGKSHFAIDTDGLKDLAFWYVCFFVGNSPQSTETKPFSTFSTRG